MYTWTLNSVITSSMYNSRYVVVKKVNVNWNCIKFFTEDKENHVCYAKGECDIACMVAIYT